MITGFIMYLNKDGKLNPQEERKWLVSASGWTLSICFLSTIAIHDFWKTTHALDENENFSRELWAASICWIVFACHQLETGWLVRSFLSSTFWQPLSKLCLSIYIAQYSYIFMTYVSQKDLEYIPISWQAHVHVGDLVVALTFGKLLYLFVEAPTSNVLQMIIQKKTRVSPVEKLPNIFEMIGMKKSERLIPKNN